MIKRTVMFAVLLALCAGELARAGDEPVSLGEFSGTGGSRGKMTIKNSLSLGVQFGSSFFYPTFSYQRMLVRRVALGATLLYAQGTEGNTQSKVYGGFLTLNLYSSRGDFTGFWLQAGYGYLGYTFKLLNDSEFFSRQGGLLTLGLRSRWYNVVRVGVAAGFVSVPKIDSKLINVGLSGTTPLVQVDLGFSF